MPNTELPEFATNWIQGHPILAAVAGLCLLAGVVVLAVKYGDIHNW